MLEVTLSETVGFLKTMIQDQLGIPVEQQRLMCGGKTLENRRTLSAYNIQSNSTIYLVIRLCEGSLTASHL